MACDGPMDVMGWDGMGWDGGGVMDVMRGGDVTCPHSIYTNNANNVMGYGVVGC